MSQIPLYLSNNFIEWGQREGVEITPLKLQKLLYLFYARYCYTQQARPFEDCFERWRHGPVAPSMYHALKHYGSSALKPLYDIEGKIIKISPKSEPFNTVFAEVVNQFGKKTAFELVDILHGENTAWARAHEDGRQLSTVDIQNDGRILFG
ncbi:MAG: DUF4065 domain-containing protein [Oscillospiraceae bacterium]|nr:DUF4065 domain-containing protein [Oscillospiraceae bacterium]